MCEKTHMVVFLSIRFYSQSCHDYFFRVMLNEIKMSANHFCKHPCRLFMEKVLAVPNGLRWGR